MTSGPLSRPALLRVVASLLSAERARARGRRAGGFDGSLRPLPCLSDDTRITGFGPGDLGCDSLEALWLSSAVCEMFHLADAGEQHGTVASDRVGDWLDAIERTWAKGVGVLTFTTSGTSGTPKRCVHDLQALIAEARHFASLFADRRRVLAYVPAHHIYGFLFTALLPYQLGADVLDALAATQALSDLRSGDLIVAFPERWSSIERMVTRWQGDVAGVTSTAPCPRALIEALSEAGLAAMTEIYGSSETAGIATRTWPSPDYRLLPWWNFDADDAGLVAEAGRRAMLPDAITRRGSDAFTLAGRRDGAVQVGGVNVNPNLVADALASTVGVASAAVRLMRPEEGTRLKAFIVSDETLETTQLEAQIHAFLERTLEPAARPTLLTFGSRLPSNELGKPADW